MRTSETLLLDFIRQSPQFRIPVNQRRYAWTKRHCRQLWEDILDAGERQDVREHFLGPIMYVAAVDPLIAHWAPFMVYDGQQRLTTITLILKTLSRHLKDDSAPDGFGPDQIGSEYLVNPFGKGDQHYRLVLKAGDAETLLALVHDRPLPAEPSARITEALAFFETRIKQLGPDVSPLCAGLRKLRIVAFQLKEGEDNPHRIFETMNTCGRGPHLRRHDRQLHPDAARPGTPGTALRRPPAAHRTGLRAPRGRTLRCVHPRLPDAEDGRGPEAGGGIRGLQDPCPLTPGRGRRSRGAQRRFTNLRRSLPRHGARRGRPMRSSHWPLESSPAST